MKRKSGLIFLVTVALMGCTIKPKAIAYGTDGCHFCRMTIVDHQHAAELVTDKGKVFKFDAVECMVNYLNEEKRDVGLLLVCDYNQPGNLIDATKATFLISKGIPSPMGEFLTAFEKKEEAEKAKSEHGGTLYDWQELVAYMDK